MRNNKNPTLGCLSYCNSRIIPANKKSQAAMEQPFQNAGKRIESRHKAYCNNRIIPANKKSQAAMEFLMTYGWALLVVIVVIAALAYFGLLNPSRFLPEKCEFQPGLSSPVFRAMYTEESWNSYHVNGNQQSGTVGVGGLEIFIRNDLGERMRNVRLEVEECGPVVTISGHDAATYHPITYWTQEFINETFGLWEVPYAVNLLGDLCIDSCDTSSEYLINNYEDFPRCTAIDYEGNIGIYIADCFVSLGRTGSPVRNMALPDIIPQVSHPVGETIGYRVSNCGLAPNSRFTSDVTIRYEVMVAGQLIERTNRGRISVWVQDLRS